VLFCLSLDYELRANAIIDNVGEKIQLIDSVYNELEPWVYAYKYFRKCQCLLLVCSYDIPSSVDFLEFARDTMLKERGIDTFPCVVAINKCDLPVEKRKFDMQYLHSKLPWLVKDNVPIFQVSAKNDTEIDACIVSCIREIKKSMQQEVQGSKQNLKQTQKQQKQINAKDCLIQ